MTDLGGPDVRAKIGEARVVLVNGWNFRAHGLTLRHGEEIRRYFRPIRPLEEASRAVVEGLRKNADLVVGVHVRRGDYATWQNGNFFFELARYAAWMRQLAEQFPGQRLAFFVCSNEPLAESDFAGLSVGFGQGHPVSDLYGLGECDYLFGPPSTYSQWASFYGTSRSFMFMRLAPLSNGSGSPSRTFATSQAGGRCDPVRPSSDHGLKRGRSDCPARSGR